MKSGRSEFPRLIGVIHLPALAGAPGARALHPTEALERAGRIAVQEARSLEKLGFEAVILENFGDIPFYREQVPPETVASLAVIAAAVRESIKIPIGINVLRNDARAALAIASVVGAQWIRVNVLSGVAATDQGWIEGRAAELLRERDRLQSDTRIFADVHVKHAQTYSTAKIEDAVADTALRAGADALIVSGSGTGKAVHTEILQTASRAARSVGKPLYIGSGATVADLELLLPWVHGVIVSSALRKGSQAGAPLDLGACGKFVKAFYKKPSRTKKARAKKR